MDNLCPNGQHKPKHKLNWLFFLNNKGEAGGDGGDGGGSGDGGDGGSGGGDGGGGGTATATAGWKDQLSTDLKGFVESKSYDNDADGLNKAMESYANLEKLLGHEKVPIPKGDDDVEGWNRFSKAMGIPDAADQYGLPDMDIPEALQGNLVDKQKFSEIVHAHKLTPAQAKGLWEAYSQLSIDGYKQSLEKMDQDFDTTITKLRGEWGDAYDTNIELGQAVINKFGADQDAIDFITSALGRDPRGIKFLAKIGDQFAENKIGEFQMKRFSLAPEEAQAEIDQMTRDLEGPYMNTSGKFTQAEHQAAIDRVNYLRVSINKARG